ncbi:Stp1/IreP family PP2C-type Ser/Thr phosphatase [Bacillus sp. B15-48]|uniref:Stp1/IreP family PP2C-type Ser/Thr phosphatase n=1 Tax=Bacillus sp. B15-48 TaxID=1548601 RepID=UPI00193F00AE|nr:Stp1/IreP family PP2C-type Ser/Thr phosphatase [Bacillus sp. B15-48]MBM4763977.1 Stp1/IreP family PP2C-type Ser/Thr phosphatase [Bacillus sp. B15-48]
MNTIFLTDRGKVRSHNEDSGGIFMNQVGQYLAIVADGMGGHRAGDVASEMTVLFLKDEWKKVDKLETAEQAEDWLKNKIIDVNKLVFQHSQQNADCKGMGTTLVAAICTESFATFANIGDSRGYILNETGIQQLTEDHSLVNELLRSGQISKEDAENHPRKNVLLRALGTEETISLDKKTIIIESGDYLMLCSDGLSNKVNEDEMAKILTEEGSLSEKASNLIRLANDYGGEDNITLAIIEYPDVLESR